MMLKMGNDFGERVLAGISGLPVCDRQTGMLINNYRFYFLGRRICGGNCDLYHLLATI
jgi:hypothetical protein